MIVTTLLTASRHHNARMSVPSSLLSVVRAPSSEETRCRRASRGLPGTRSIWGGVSSNSNARRQVRENPRDPTRRFDRHRASCAASGKKDPGMEEKTTGTAAEAGGLQQGHVHARVVVAGAAADIGVVARGQRRDSLAVVARAEPGALEGGDDARPHRVRDLEGQMDLAEIVPHSHHRAPREAPRPRVVWM